MKRWLAVLFAFVCSAANAGYYSVVQSVVGPATALMGRTSTCVLLPSMTVTALTEAGSRWRVTSITTDGNWTAVYFDSTTVTAKYYPCVAEPAVSGLPSFDGGVSDPAIKADGVLSGSGGASSGSTGGNTATAADIATLGIDAESVLYVWTWGFGSVVFMWFLGFGIGAGKTAIRKV